MIAPIIRPQVISPLTRKIKAENNIPITTNATVPSTDLLLFNLCLPKRRPIYAAAVSAVNITPSDIAAIACGNNTHTTAAAAKIYEQIT